MVKCRQRKAALTPVAAEPAPSNSPVGEVWESLPNVYSLDDMYDPSPTSNDLTVDQEYNNFAVAVVSPKGTNLVKFWEVWSQLLMHLCFRVTNIISDAREFSTDNI
jgi:hypothetical protein